MALDDTGIVIIARNEGERFRRAVASCAGLARCVVFADSGSSDGSAAHARSMGVEVVELERPWSQPRGRNAGLRRLLELAPEVHYVFFMDGDCELVPAFLQAGRAFLERDPRLGAVCGRRLELRPQDSVYNRLVDMEWNTAVGEGECGGDMLVRAEALKPLQGYREGMVSGEDFELCHRLRLAGWRVQRIDADMTRHDVGIRRFGAWWKRHARGGYSFAHAAALNWGPPHWYKVDSLRTIVQWGFALPLAALAFAPLTRGASLAAYLLLNALLWWKVRRWRMREMRDDTRSAGVYAFFVTIGKFAEFQGVAGFLWKYARGRAFTYVEYKDYQRPQRSKP
jgi:cellulose synthase/poly-beta-1,6-N-acetylglucosamine synthase-like glycosyltransferase